MTTCHRIMSTVPFFVLISLCDAHAVTYSVLYSFTGGSDGGWSYAGLVRDSAGNLYGTTGYGGDGYGTVFKPAPDGTEAVLHAFDGTDGNVPHAGLRPGMYPSVIDQGQPGAAVRQKGEQATFVLTTVLVMHTTDLTGGQESIRSSESDECSRRQMAMGR